MDSGGVDGTRCPEPATEVDHVLAHALGGSSDLGNLQALCSWHHNAKTAKDRRKANAARKASGALGQRSRTRQPEQHPGLIQPEPSASPSRISTGRGYSTPALGWLGGDRPARF